MKEVTRAMATRSRRETGAVAVEYALLAALIAVAIITAAYFVGSNLSLVFNDTANRLGTPGSTSPPPGGPGPTLGPGQVVLYVDCNAVRAAGAAPIHAGDPGYSSALDPDGDGVGCE